MLKLWSYILAVLLYVSLAGAYQARAASIYMNIPDIPGESSVGGYPAAIAVQSLTVSQQAFSVVKNVDKASPGIVQAVAEGTDLGTVNVLLYNSSTAGPADASLAFPSVHASAHQFLGGNMPTEKDSFASSAPASMYLAVPGITGESSVPGYANVMAVQSFTLSGNELTVVKEVDKASVQIAQAVAEGKHFSSASLLIYDSAPTGPPRTTIAFQDLNASSYQILPSTSNIPQEQVGFEFAKLLSPAPAPEPSSNALLVTAGISLAGFRWRRRSQVSA